MIMAASWLTPPPHVDLPGLVRQVRCGDQSAFAALYAATVEVVQSMVPPGRPEAQVEQVIIDTYVAAWRHIGQAELTDAGVWTFLAERADEAQRVDGSATRVAP